MSRARQALVDAALDLFLHEGLHAVGIERILTHASVSKMTLYKYFKSKDDLIVAVLEQYHTQILDEMQQAVAAASTLPEQLTALDSWYEARFGDPGLRGCLFVTAAIDYPDVEHPVHQVAQIHKDALIDFFRRRLASAGLPEPEIIALQLVMVFEGARSLRNIGVSPDPFAAAARPLIRLLLAAASGALVPR
ncbi:TetR/AcrR family transcriptional regulator [Chitinibacteraceae bacterium HSL-7]